MENNAIPVARIGSSIKPVAWSRCNRELTGRSGRSYIHGASQLLMQSYTEIGAVPHDYHIIATLCPTHARHARSYPLMRMIYEDPDTAEGLLHRGILPVLQSAFSGLGVSAMEFDTKGTYLASATRSGCLSVHKYESLYNHKQGEDEKEPAWHGFLADQGIHAIRWNPIDQAEIAYATWRSGELKILDLGFSHATNILRKRTSVNVLFLEGLSDIAFVNEGTRVLASDLVGEVSMWDLRAGDLPQMVLTSTEKSISLNSIQLHGNQFVCGASKSGFIHTWDLRGGRSSNSSQSDSEVHPPMTSINLKSMLNKLRPLRPRAKIWQRDIQSININPSCTYQLGFHLGDGCSGVFDMHTSRVSHIHCPPPPPWMSNTLVPVLPPRRPAWLQHSIYAAASSSSRGLYLLDFHPRPSSPFYVDNTDSKSPQERVKHEQGVFVPLSIRATSCATHPLDGTIVVGTMKASLLMVSQENLSKKGDGEEDDHEGEDE